MTPIRPGATSPQFRTAARAALDDARLQTTFGKVTGIFANHRLDALAELPDSDALRDHLKQVRAATIARLADYLETFERQAVANGAHVHWAADEAEAAQIIVGIARQHGATLATKSKSMTTEEIGLNAALLAAGIEPVETDLGEYIIQIAHEPPSHIIAPAMHKTRQQVAELFSAATGKSLPPDDIPRLTAEARALLRQKFLTAGIGISGSNMAVAETGSVIVVENEGNARMVTGAPPVHVALLGIEKIAANWDDAAAWLALLARSATGQPLSVYTNIISGPAREGDPDGPREMHIVLLDNQRSQQPGTRYEEILQCIRCGACLNVCPVYGKTGGHAYGSPYNGPIGAVISPCLFGLERYEGLPQASSLCGACRDACPVRIDLPGMLLELRRETVERGLAPWPKRLIGRAAAFIFQHPRLFRLAGQVGRLLQRPFVRAGQLRLPAGLNPGHPRQLPGLARRSFGAMWESGELEEAQ